MAFGCSNTYGQALPDCPDLTASASSKYAWPEVFAKSMKKSCLNLAELGSSNRQILLKILNFDGFNNNDCVAVLWSFITRETIVKSKNTADLVQLHIQEWPHQPVENLAWRKYKVETYNEYNEMLRSLHYIDYADRYLKDKVKYTMHYVTDNILLEHTEPYIQAELIRNGKLLMTRYPRGLDNAHPGVEGHQALGLQAVQDFNNMRKRKIKNETK